jgi:ornithine carbamoyltransferase
MQEALEGADIVYPKSWAPYSVMEQRTSLLREKRNSELAALEKECLANNAKYMNWECNADLMKRTRDGRALYMHCLPADITSVSCKNGEVSAGVFDHYRLATYREAGHKPYVIAAMMLLTRFADPVATLRAAIDRKTPRRLGSAF